MPELMTVEELGQYLRFTRKTIYKLLKQGSIPSIKIGNKWRFDKEAIDKWLHQSINGTKARILVIDDDEVIRSLFKETLEEQGHTVVTAGTSAEGIDRVKRWDFDLVFLDLKIPEMDGAELIKQLKSINPKLPVTIITGYPDSDTMKKALREGPLGVMDKPFDAQDIIAAVNSFLHVTEKTSEKTR
ncbi:MAG: response regulator [Dehalococcoidales bacterium]|nr:response regulator [Dehalococcoidia bacterium]MBL7166418.1 response regulator [Dehalococcoidales bacterium]